MLLQLVLPGELSRADTADEWSLARVYPSVPRQVRRSRESQRTEVAGKRLVLRLVLGLDHLRLLPLAPADYYSLHLDLPFQSHFRRFVQAPRGLLQITKITMPPAVDTVVSEGSLRSIRGKYYSTLLANVIAEREE